MDDYERASLNTLPSAAALSESEVIIISAGRRLTPTTTAITATRQRVLGPTQSAASKLLRKSRSNCHRRFPLTALQVILFGLILMLAILACIVIETWWASRKETFHRPAQKTWSRKEDVDEEDGDVVIERHSAEDKKYHEKLVNDVNTNLSALWHASYNKFASRSHDGHAPTSDKESMRQALAKNIESNEWTKTQMFADTEEHLRYLTSLRGIGPLPTEFDARKRWPLCNSIHQVVNQAGCGSCWAMSSTAVMSDRICIHSNASQQVRISAQDLIECCRHCGGCSGTVWALFSFVYWKEHGLVTGGDYGSYEGCKPYEKVPNCGYPCHLDIHGAGDEHNPTSAILTSLFGHHKHSTEVCYPVCQPIYRRDYEDDLHRGRSVYWLRPNALNKALYSKTMSAVQQLLQHANMTWEQVLKRELFLNGPLMGCFVVYDEFQHYRSGIYQSRTSATTNELYGHCAKLLGWGEERLAGGRIERYWVYANTWGREWGENGFFRLAIDETPEEAAAGLPLII